MPNRRYDAETTEAFTWHLARYVADAARQSLLDGAETETNPGEFLRFAEARFHTLIHSFEDSFFDCWDGIGRPFREAALRQPRGQGLP
jgi:hypothetical protein